MNAINTKHYPTLVPPRGGQLLLTPKTDCRLTAAVPPAHEEYIII